MVKTNRKNYIEVYSAKMQLLSDRRDFLVKHTSSFGRDLSAPWDIPMTYFFRGLVKDRKNQKISIESFIENPVENEIFRDWKFSIEHFPTEFSMKISMKSFWFFSISKNFATQLWRILFFDLLNRFGQKFVQNYVELNGGDCSVEIRAISMVGMPLQQKRSPLRSVVDFYTPSTRGAISLTSLEMWLTYRGWKNISGVKVLHFEIGLGRHHFLGGVPAQSSRRKASTESFFDRLDTFSITNHATNTLSRSKTTLHLIDKNVRCLQQKCNTRGKMRWRPS